jgi:hypothetical protein
MKKYDNVEIELVLLQAQDVVRTSIGFEGEGDGFGDPNLNAAQENFTP